MIVKIENLDHNGRGITRINNKVTFVNNALQDEIVDIKLTKEKKNYNEAEVISIIERHVDRKTPECKYYHKCGGCDLMHINYKSQIEFKVNKVKNIIKKYAGLEIEPEVYPSNKEFNYRNKITLHEQNGKVGYMKKNSNEILEINECPLVLNCINDYFKNNKKEIKKELIIRANEKENVISSLKNENIIIEINNLKFQVNTNSFFQVNNYICGKLFEFLEKNIEKCNNCLDLYSGVGTLSIVASKKANLVYSIEVNKNSHKNAIKNLKINNIENIKFILGKVENEIKQIKDKIDLIITDPPRSGIDKKTLEIIKKLKPKKIIYISCDPMTLARDLNNLKENYNITNTAIFDMFPNTKHVECICVLNS